VTALATLAALALASGEPAVPVSVPVETAEAPAGACALLAPDSGRATVAECLACHGGSGSGHPVGLDYGAFAGRPGLRSEADAVAIGIFLPEGELRCTTCHDGRSRVRHRIALPPGADVRTAVVPGDPATYTQRRLSPAALEGRAVSPKPLCLGCHAF